VEKQNEPFLLGFGTSSIIDVLKKANRDKFKGLYLMDNNLIDYIEKRSEVYQQKRIFGLFSRNKKDKVYYQRLDTKLRVTAETSLTMMDMHKVYVSVIKKIIE
jgi:hypothetical protein